jgi:hypothetical protein
VISIRAHDDLANINNEANDQLGNVVTGSRLSGENIRPGNDSLAFLWRRLFDGQVTVNDRKNVQCLTFVLERVSVSY